MNAEETKLVNYLSELLMEASAQGKDKEACIRTINRNIKEIKSDINAHGGVNRVDDDNSKVFISYRDGYMKEYGKTEVAPEEDGTDENQPDAVERGSAGEGSIFSKENA